MNQKVKISANGKSVLVDFGTLLSDALFIEKPCGGRGACGKCKVVARGALSEMSASERERLTEREMLDGVRLACMTAVLGDCEVFLRKGEEDGKIVSDGHFPPFSPAPIFSRYGVAIDIGTTTLVARLFDQAGEMLTEASSLNPQAEFGADVISRVEAALAGKSEMLAKAIQTAIDQLLRSLARQARIDAKEIDGLVITGNTVMLSLLTKENVTSFSCAPFALGRTFGEELVAAQLSLSSVRATAKIYLPPCISAFVGADMTCAILSTRLCEKATAMVADIGTNGEMALWHKGRLTVCSTAAGPAFEGVGISMGMRAAAGAIDKIELVGGELLAHVIGGGSPRGICGSGLVDAAATMLLRGDLDESGDMEESPTVIAAPVSVSAEDIRALQLAKSAICAGMLTLMETEAANASELDALYVAGGFGHFLNVRNAARIGLFPSALAKKASAVGNAALAGATLLLLSADERQRAEEIASKAIHLPLATNPIFSRHYLEGMSFGER